MDQRASELRHLVLDLKKTHTYTVQYGVRFSCVEKIGRDITDLL